MSAELHVLSGDRAGLVLPLDGAVCTVGRHPGCSLRFGADAARGVSARHARLEPEGAGWRLRDLGSTNGTWINGRRVDGDVLLRDGDHIAFGEAGPVVEFRDPAGRAPRPSAPARRRPPRGVGGRWAAGAAGVLLAGAAAAIHLTGRAALVESSGLPVPLPAEAVGERRLADDDDSRHAWSSAAAPRSPGVAIPSRANPSSPARGRTPPRPAGGADTQATARAEPARAPVVDRRNRRAVARIWVESEDGEVSTGTAFAVRGDGTLITSRHVVAGRPRRIAVQFAGSTQAWRARVLAVSGEWDLAAVKVDDIVGDVPTVLGLNLRPDTLVPGAPLVLVGFPRAGDAEEGAPARPAVSGAAFARVRGGRVEAFARSAVGASGSPVFDAHGQVVGILFGGAPGGERPLLYAVPAAAVERLIGT